MLIYKNKKQTPILVKFFIKIPHPLHLKSLCQSHLTQKQPFLPKISVYLKKN